MKGLMINQEMVERLVPFIDRLEVPHHGTDWIRADAFVWIVISFAVLADSLPCAGSVNGAIFTEI